MGIKNTVRYADVCRDRQLKHCGLGLSHGECPVQVMRQERKAFPFVDPAAPNVEAVKHYLCDAHLFQKLQCLSKLLKVDFCQHHDSNHRSFQIKENLDGVQNLFPGAFLPGELVVDLG